MRDTYLISSLRKINSKECNNNMASDHLIQTIDESIRDSSSYRKKYKHEPASDSFFISVGLGILENIAVFKETRLVVQFNEILAELLGNQDDSSHDYFEFIHNVTNSFLEMESTEGLEVISEYINSTEYNSNFAASLNTTFKAIFGLQNQSHPDRAYFYNVTFDITAPEHSNIVNRFCSTFNQDVLIIDAQPTLYSSNIANSPLITLYKEDNEYSNIEHTLKAMLKSVNIFTTIFPYSLGSLDEILTANMNHNSTLTYQSLLEQPSVDQKSNVSQRLTLTGSPSCSECGTTDSTLRTLCGKDHCRTCLLRSIKKGISKCPCAKELSLKNKVGLLKLADHYYPPEPTIKCTQCGNSMGVDVITSCKKSIFHSICLKCRLKHLENKQLTCPICNNVCSDEDILKFIEAAEKEALEGLKRCQICNKRAKSTKICLFCVFYSKASA